MIGSTRIFAAAAVASLTVSAGATEAKTCKEPITSQSRSTVAGSEADRTRRATDNAQKKWSKDVKAKFGFAYQFWLRADSKSTDCHQTPKSTVCKVTATPCRII